ncbi:hypothetical protein HAX54_046744 [Datura stramonium]|uniref:Protein kinase domain-containing protein n=1 Tax=Datura stramonium TaxID=4076 RepID=A0ABS8WJC6_DATST|nr:hypothetical protein [Datura stramonium]
MGKLERLYLSNNSLSGVIPSAFGPHLGLLDLSKTNSGLIPDTFANLPQLRRLLLHDNLWNITPEPSNHLHGPIPLELSKMDMVLAIDLSSNNPLSANVPSQLGSCIALKAFQESSALQNLNFSYNHLSGNVTDTVVPSSPKVQIQEPIHSFNNSKVIEDMEQGGAGRERAKVPRISRMQLIEATGGFSSSNPNRSKDDMGRVYRGVLKNNMSIAVKVIDTKGGGEISGSFKRECQILKRTRHRNLIRILNATCSRPDFKALVFPLMPNGSLENHLYPSHGVRHQLDLAQLVSICSDVAGVAYLHHY